MTIFQALSLVAQFGLILVVTLTLVVTIIVNLNKKK